MFNRRSTLAALVTTFTITAVSFIAAGADAAGFSFMAPVKAFSGIAPVPTPNADLGITKTAPATVTESNSIPYTITVHNYGPDTATNVSVSDTLPAGSTQVVVSSGCNLVAGTVTCTAATLANGVDVVFTVVMVPSAAALNTDVVNSATVSSSVNDPNPGNNSGSATTHVNAAACTALPSGMVS